MQIRIAKYLLTEQLFRRLVSLILLFVFISNPAVAWASQNVDVQRGYFSYNHTDIGIGDALSPIAVIRHYQSVKVDGSSVSDGPFGKGTHMGIYSLWAEVNSSNQVIIKSPTGEETVYIPTSTAGRYVNEKPSAAMQGVITANGSALTLQVENGAKYNFDYVDPDGTVIPDGIRRLTYIRNRIDRYSTSLIVLHNSNGTISLVQVSRFGGYRHIGFWYQDSRFPKQVTSAWLVNGGWTLSTGFFVKYTYDANGDLVTFQNTIHGKQVKTSSGSTRTANGITTYTYDAYHHMVSITDPRGIVSLANTYNSDNTGRISSQRYPGATSSSSDDIISYYAQYGNQSTVRDTLNSPDREKTIFFDPNTQAINATYNSADQSTTEAFYDPSTGRLASTVDRHGVQKAYTYSQDYSNELGMSFIHIKAVYPAAYNAEPSSTTPPSLSSTPEIQYSFTAPFGQLSSQTDRLLNTTYFSYDANAQLSTITPPTNHYQNFPQYDYWGLLLTQSDALGRSTRNTYYLDANVFGAIVETEDLKTQTGPNGVTINYTYDGFSRAVSTYTSSAPTESVSFEYDDLNRIIKVTTPGNRITEYTYDDISNLTSVLSPNNVRTVYSYNNQGQISTRKEGNYPTQYYYYNNLGQLTQLIKRDGQSVCFNYDVKSRLEKITYACGTSSANTITYGYGADPYDRVQTVTDSTGTSKNISINYNQSNYSNYPMGPTYVTTGADTTSDTVYYFYGGPGGQLTEAYRKIPNPDYDPSVCGTPEGASLGNKQGTSTDIVCIGAGAPTLKQSLLAYTYNTDQTLQAVTLQSVDDGSASTVNFAYDSTDAIKTISYPGLTENIYYNSQGDINSVNFATSSTTLRSLTYNYDYEKKGFLSNRSESGSLVPTVAQYQSYLYNEMSELTSVSTSAGLFQYWYDADSNFTAISTPTVSVTNPGYESGSNRLNQFYGAQVVTDANGNITSDGANSYKWNSRGQLESVNNGAIRYEYDGLGRRLTRTIASTGAVTRYVYLGIGTQVFEEYTTVGVATTKKRYLVTGTDSVFMVRTTSAGVTTNEYLLHDALNNSVIASVNAASLQVRSGYGYSPFGQPTISNSSSPSGNNLLFTGREDEGLGGTLMYYRARYYSPRLQRFISEDPAGFSGGPTNFYAYAQNCPNTVMDPSGLFANIIVQINPPALVSSVSLLVDAVTSILGFFGAFFGIFGIFGGSAAAAPPPTYADNKPTPASRPKTSYEAQISKTKIKDACRIQVPKGMAVPPGFDINKNVATAVAKSDDFYLFNDDNQLSAIIDRLLWYKGVVGDQRIWDVKFHYGSQYEDFGNFHAGVIGRAVGIDRSTLLRGAGWAQQKGRAAKAGAGEPSWFNDVPGLDYLGVAVGLGGVWPYGDQPKDAILNTMGMDAFDSLPKGCY